MSKRIQEMPPREFTPAETRLLERLAEKTESPYALLETAAERSVAEAEVRADLRAGCGSNCPPEPPVAAAIVSELEGGLVHLQLGATCSRCGRTARRDYAAKP